MVPFLHELFHNQSQQLSSARQPTTPCHDQTLKPRVTSRTQLSKAASAVVHGHSGSAALTLWASGSRWVYVKESACTTADCGFGQLCPVMSPWASRVLVMERRVGCLALGKLLGNWCGRVSCRKGHLVLATPSIWSVSCVT